MKFQTVPFRCSTLQSSESSAHTSSGIWTVGAKLNEGKLRADHSIFHDNSDFSQIDENVFTLIMNEDVGLLTDVTTVIRGISPLFAYLDDLHICHPDR